MKGKNKRRPDFYGGGFKQKSGLDKLINLISIENSTEFFKLALNGGLSLDVGLNYIVGPDCVYDCPGRCNLAPQPEPPKDRLGSNCNLDL